jgi:aryl-alcohol dehydrogenase-like predicted oxidoreductase
MNYRYVGRSGLRVSPICLGTMTFGYKCDKQTSFEIMDEAYGCGVNFFDTAEVYPVPPTAERAGDTEKIVGEWMKDKPRDSLIIATKVAGAAAGWFAPPIRHSLTALDKFHIEKAVDGSLKRLQTDYIDLYQVHWPDPIVPIEDTLGALDDLVKRGKVRYVGVSNENAYGLTKALMTSQAKGLRRYESIQNNFSLLNRRFLDEIAAVCKGEGVSLLPYSPIAGGVLSGKYNDYDDWNAFRYGFYRANTDARIRAQADRFIGKRNIDAAGEYAKVARDFGLLPAVLATTWSMHFDFVASTIIGVTSVEQLKENLKAFNTELSRGILEACDEVNKRILYPMG